MAFSNKMITLGFMSVCLFGTAAANVNVGYNVYTAANVMMDKASHSWEWGTAAEALLELYNPELSVFGSNPFPNGKVPAADPSIVALQYARQYISLHGQVFVDNSAVGDPASLGVSAILLGQSNATYLSASDRQADYILNKAPRWSNGAISHRPDVAELWADNMAMSFPFLAYLAVQHGDPSLMTTAVTQCGLQRDVLKSSSGNSWQHIIGPQSQDTGLWSTGNGWAAYGMVRVLHTLQHWSGSSSMTSQASQLKGWIQEILDGAMAAGTSSGLLRNYLNDNSWFGEISGTAMLSAVAYRMAVNDPSQFPQKYIQWADANRVALAQHEGSSGVFSPAVNPYNWKDKTQYTSGSPEGQAFSIYLYTAYRDCVNAKVCPTPASSATTISQAGIGPIDILTVLDKAITFSGMPPPTGTACGPPDSCDNNGCQGAFNGLTKYPVCQAGDLKGCQCTATTNTCGKEQSCDLNGCAGKFDGLTKYARCTGNFVGCQCLVTDNTCGAHQSCDLNGCDGKFQGLDKYAECTGNFEGCQCTATNNTCGPHQSCDSNGCAGKFNGLTKYAQCTGNFVGCECTATNTTCGSHQSCDANGCAGKFNGLEKYAECTGNFEGCQCSATSNTCGDMQNCDVNGCAGAFSGNKKWAQCSGNFEGCNCYQTSKTCGNSQSCDLNGCNGSFDLDNGLAYCRSNFVGCKCSATSNTCGKRQSCDAGNCAGAFQGNKRYAQCTNFFKGCDCDATPKTCGDPQSCGLNNCDGQFDMSNGKAYCSNNFAGCECKATPGTCGPPQSCDADHCDGAFQGNVPYPVCTNFFKGCQCSATKNTCGNKQSCDNNGCAGGYDSDGVARCQGNFQGCECNPTSNTCGTPKNCDLNGCNGSFDSNSNTARCRGNFKGCVCKPVSATCGDRASCSKNGCNGGMNSNGDFVCFGNYYGCSCIPDPIWIPPPSWSHYPPHTTTTTTSTPPPQETCYLTCDHNSCNSCKNDCPIICGGQIGAGACLSGCHADCDSGNNCNLGCNGNIHYKCP